MPVVAANTYGAGRLDPVYDVDDAITLTTNMAPGTYVRGAVIGQSTAAVNEVQALTMTASGGTYTLTVTDPISGVTKTTGALNFGDIAATIQTALNAVGVLGAAGAGVTGTNPYVITFSGTAYAGVAQPLVVVNTASLTGGTATIARTTSGTRAGVSKLYASGNSDGSQIPKGILQYDCFVDAMGLLYLGVNSATSQWGEIRRSVPYYFAGTFDTTKLTGLDANALTAGAWRLISGTVAAGVVRLG